MRDGLTLRFNCIYHHGSNTQSVLTLIIKSKYIYTSLNDLIYTKSMEINQLRDDV